MAQSDRAPKRCAIYTRKSSEEGLEQNFNSLHAQRQACEAYVKSQAGEGWQVVKTAFDDGGFSGATMDRPALKALLDHVKEKRIDVVVVYKVDRLTRSLADFAKIVEIFDAEGVSFVAVTQQFNTTTSMGRLTLNVLLSFAQSEREVTGERIRDKIAASKQKGMWMGGGVPLGYDLSDRRLVVNPVEAETVRLIFELYLEFKTLRRVRDELDRRAIVSKRSVSKGVCITIPGEAVTASRTDPALLRALVRGYLWFNELASGRVVSTRQIADREGLSDSYVRQVVPLGLLAPAIVESICGGRQSVSLSAERLKDHARLPVE